MNIQLIFLEALMPIQRSDHVPAKHLGTILLLCCCWHIWKWRNNTVFRNERTSLAGALAAGKTEAFLWGGQTPGGRQAHRGHLM